MNLTHPWKNKPTLRWQTARDREHAPLNEALPSRGHADSECMSALPRNMSGDEFCTSVLTAEFIADGQEGFKIFKCISCRASLLCDATLSRADCVRLFGDSCLSVMCLRFSQHYDMRVSSA